MQLFGRKIPFSVSLLFWFVLWELAGWIGLSSIFPPISKILLVATTVFTTEKFIKAIEISARTFALGMSLSLVVGIGVGTLMARIKIVREILGMWVNIFVSAPISALVPILMSVLGIGEATVVATVFLFAVFIIILDTQVGIDKADRSLVEMGKSLGANRYQMFTKILFLGALPEILAGIRLGVIRGVKGCVIGQLLISIIGIGELFEFYSMHFLMEEFWALVIVVFAVAFFLSEAIAFFERRVEYYAGTR